MKPAALSFCGFLLTLACSPAFAEPQALITVDPNNFAPGQNISNATTGATLRSLTFIANPDLNALPQQAYIPQYSPVFAEAVTTNCRLELAPVPCAPIGHTAFSYMSSSVPSSQPIIWGAANKAVPCAMGFCYELPDTYLPVLRVDFASPTNSVSVMLTNYDSDNGELAAFSSIAAFDDTGQLISVCYSTVPAFGSGCDGTYIVGPVNGNGDAWVRVTLYDPNASIRFALIGGASSDPMLSMLQFNSPVSLQLAGLLTKVKGVGPGKSLANAIMFAQTYYAVPDIQSTCTTLTGFMSEVSAQSGKKISTPTASQLLGTTRAIETALNCH